MLRMLLGRALWRWLEGLAGPSGAQAGEEHTPGPPMPQVVLDPTTVVDSTSATMVGLEAEAVYPRVQRAAMGSLFEVYLAGKDRDALVGAAEDALDEVARLDAQLSHYREDSDIGRLNAHAVEQWVRVEPRLYALLKRSAELWADTDGAFDITVGPLVRLWGFHDCVGRVPTDDEVAEALGRVGVHRLALDDADALVLFSVPGMELNLGAIGKGYAIDEAADRLRFYGVSSGLLHGGQSTVYGLGTPPGGDGWELTLRDPRDHQTPLLTVRLRDEAISTSAGYEQSFEAQGRTYGHVIDARTGRPADGPLSVWVMAPSAADSDALSTAFYVLGRPGAKEYCRAHPNIRVVIADAGAGGALDVWDSAQP